MTTCPLCDYDNIEGVDLCDQCGQSLMNPELHLHPPATEVERSLLKDPVKVLEPRAPISVDSAMSVRDAMKLLVEKRIGCVVVTEKDELVGIFSERDALIKINTQFAEMGDRPVADFMTREPQTLDANAKVAFAVQRMDLGSYRHVPIVDEQGVAVGIISVRDILRYLTEKMSAN